MNAKTIIYWKNQIYLAESEEVEKILSTTERLRKDLMTNYDASISPALYSSASIRLVLEYHLQSLSLDVKKSVLRTHGTLLAVSIYNRVFIIT